MTEEKAEISVVEALTKQTEAIKELTKEVSRLSALWEKWSKAGKF